MAIEKPTTPKKWTDVELRDLDDADLYTILTAPCYQDSQEHADMLEPVLQAVFDRKSQIDPKAFQQFMAISNNLAEMFGLPTAVAKYAEHKNLSGWKGLSAAELKYSFACEDGPHGLFHENLRNKIVADVASMAGASDPDKQVKDMKDGDLVGIKVSDATLSNELMHKLTDLTPTDLAKFKGMSDDQIKKELSWLTGLSEAVIDQNWEAWQKTWDSAQKAILSKNTPEDMGQEMCLQLFLMPFKLLENYTAKMDDWVKDWAKKRAAALQAERLNGSKGEEGKDPTPELDEEIKKQAAILATFKNEYLARTKAEAEKDPSRKPFADELADAFSQDWSSAKEFSEAHPDLATKLYKDFEVTLVKEENLDLTAMFFASKFFPDEVKDVIRQKLKEAGFTIPKEWEKAPDIGEHEGTPKPTKDKKEPTSGDDKKPRKRKGKESDKESDSKGSIDFHKKSSKKPPKKILRANMESLSAASRAEKRIRGLIWGDPEAMTASPYTIHKGGRNDADYFGTLLGLGEYPIKQKDAKGNVMKGPDGKDIILDDKHVITRYHQKGKDITSVTYFLDEGKAVIMNGSNTATDTEPIRIIEGLGTDHPTMNGRPLSEKAAKSWNRRLKINQDLYNTGRKNNFKGTIVDRLQQDSKKEWANIRATMETR